MARRGKRRSSVRGDYSASNYVAPDETLWTPPSRRVSIDDARFYHPEGDARHPLAVTSIPADIVERYGSSSAPSRKRSAAPIYSRPRRSRSASSAASRKGSAAQYSQRFLRKAAHSAWKSAFAFAHPPRVVTCIRRWTRKEVLFAKRIAGRRGRPKHKPRWTWRSMIRC